MVRGEEYKEVSCATLSLNALPLMFRLIIGYLLMMANLSPPDASLA